MDDEDQAPSHFRIDPPTVPCPELGTTLPNLWFVLSPVLQEIRPIYKSGLEFCPLCQVRHRVFYCCDCVSKGEFTHSNPRKPGDLAEKRNHFKTLDDHRRVLAGKIESQVETTSKTQLLGEQIKLTKQRIKYLNNIIKERSEITAKSKFESQKLKAENAKRTQRLPKFGSKVDKIDQYARQHLASLTAQKIKVNQKMKSLAAKRRQYVTELSRYIFPIELVEIPSQATSAEKSDCSEETFDAIMAEMKDAMSTSYIHGRWVTTSMSDGAAAIQLEGDKQWKIVAPHLPANDSILYSLVASSAEALTSTSTGLISPLHTIMGGLTFTVQFLNQIAACLDIIFPKRLFSSDFNLAAPSEFLFAKKLARMNINVAHLCLAQGLDFGLIRPTEALFNLSQFLDHIKNGQFGHKDQPYKSELIFDMSVTICSELGKIQPTIEDVENESDQNEEEDLLQDWDTWESVPSDMMVVNPMLNHMPSSPSPPPHLASTAGSVVSSWLRGITSPTGSPASPHK